MQFTRDMISFIFKPYNDYCDACTHTHMRQRLFQAKTLYEGREKKRQPCDWMNRPESVKDMKEKAEKEESSSMMRTDQQEGRGYVCSLLQSVRDTLWECRSGQSTIMLLWPCSNKKGDQLTLRKPWVMHVEHFMIGTKQKEQKRNEANGFFVVHMTFVRMAMITIIFPCLSPLNVSLIWFPCLSGRFSYCYCLRERDSRKESRWVRVVHIILTMTDPGARGKNSVSQILLFIQIWCTKWNSWPVDAPAGG